MVDVLADGYDVHYGARSIKYEVLCYALLIEINFIAHFVLHTVLFAFNHTVLFILLIL